MLKKKNNFNTLSICSKYVGKDPEKSKSLIGCPQGKESVKAMAPHSSTFAWKIPWTEEPGRLQSMGLLESDTTERLHLHFSLSCIGGGNGNPLQCSCLENPSDGEAWWAVVYGVAQSWTRLKRLSSSSSNSRARSNDRHSSFPTLLDWDPEGSGSFFLFWLCWVFDVACRLPLAVVCRLLIAVASLVAEYGF